jgi:16S rRNA (uracil1498-N3)-methyltransferase
MPGSPRLFINSRLGAGAEVDLTAEQTHYLATVLRRTAGDSLVLFNGTDGEWQARLASISRRGARAAVGEVLRPPRAEGDLWLLFAPLKRDATELVVQKATELGVSALCPVITERTNMARMNLARLAAIAVEAAEQSERLTVPRVLAPEPLAAVLTGWQAGRTLVAAIERAPLASLRSVEWCAPSALLIGPEGGFTRGELDVLHAHPFVKPASLGPLILRAETAAIVGLALMLAAPPR